MTAEDFCSWVNLNLLPPILETNASVPSKITAHTAKRWLHKLEISSKKGIYIDGYEQADVVKYQKLYLKKLEILATTHLPPPLCTVMSLLPMQPCLQVLITQGNLCLFLTMKAYFIPMMTKGGCGVNKTRQYYNLRVRGVLLW